MGMPEDLLPGRRIVAYFQPFLEHLAQLNLSRKTLRKHVDNLWILGGEIIRDLNEAPSLRKVPIEHLIFDLVREGGRCSTTLTQRRICVRSNPPAGNSAASSNNCPGDQPPYPRIPRRRLTLYTPVAYGECVYIPEDGP